MYEAFYGLREKPFNLTPDPKFLYLSEKHKEAFAHLLFGIKNRSGFVMVTGEIGTGKTTICRTLLNELDENTEVAFIFNPYLSPEELLRKINEDFGIDSKAETVRELIDELNAYLLDRNTKGKNCVLVIDEAQNLTPGVLEQIRLLSNLETETTKLLQIVLIGQPELMQHLSLDELRQLNQRITARYHLHPLERQETLQYIAYRLRVAGGRRRINFTPGAVKVIYKHSGGTPRVINAICDRALLIGYTKETREITAAIAKQAWIEIRGEKVRKKKEAKPFGFRRLIPGPTMLAVAALVLVAGKYGMDYWHSASGGDLSALLDRVNPIAAKSSTAEARARDVTAAMERPVQVETPAMDGTFDPTFAGLIDRMNPDECRNGSAIAMLRAWNLALLTNLPPDDSEESIRTFAENSRLTCEVMELTPAQIEAINLPVLVRLHGRKQSVWSAVTGVEFDELRLTTSESDTTLIPKETLGECYQGEALLFWRDPNPDAPILRSEMTGEEIRILQSQLRALGRYKEKPNGVYDKATRAAVTAVQKDTGLEVDGILGSRTRMVLYSWLPGFSTPALRPLPPLNLRADWEEKPESKPEPKPQPPKAVAKKVEAPKPAPVEAKPEVTPAEEDPKTEPTEEPRPEPQEELKPEPQEPATLAEAPNAVTPENEAVVPAAPKIEELPPPPAVPVGPVDPFADIEGSGAVTAEELDAPGGKADPPPENVMQEQPPAEVLPVTSAPEADLQDPVVSAEEPAEDPADESEKSAPPTLFGMPLVPSVSGGGGGN
jgi:general secretion pathway protein A